MVEVWSAAIRLFCALAVGCFLMMLNLNIRFTQWAKYLTWCLLWVIIAISGFLMFRLLTVQVN